MAGKELNTCNSILLKQYSDSSFFIHAAILTFGPEFHILKCFRVCDVIDDESCICLAVVHGGHGFESLLTCRVP